MQKSKKKAVRLKDNQFNSTGIKERLINLTESHEGSLDKWQKTISNKKLSLAGPIIYQPHPYLHQQTQK